MSNAIEMADRAGIGNMKGEMAVKYPDAVFLSGAEMDFKTAPVIRKALVSFAQNGLYGYTLPYRDYTDAVIRWMKKTRGLSLHSQEIVPALGTVFSVSTAVRAFTAKGEKVLIQSPSYYRFDRAVLRNHRQIVYNPLKERNGVYSLDFPDMERKMADPKLKMMILCNPHNPTGCIFEEKDLREIARLAVKYDVIIFCDEIFGEITFEKEGFVSYLSVSQKNVLVSTSLGKAFNFTGVNQANILIRDVALREKFLAQQETDHIGSIDPFFYTALKAAYSREGYEWISRIKEIIYENYLYMKDFLKRNVPVLSVSPLSGGYILWMDCRKLSMNDEELEAFMTQKVQVIGDPGMEYGEAGRGFYRFNLAASREKISEMAKRLQENIPERLLTSCENSAHTYQEARLNVYCIR